MSSERAPSRRSGPVFMLAGEVSGDPELSRLEASLEIDLKRRAEGLAEQAKLYYRARLRASRAAAALAQAEADRASAEGRIEGYLASLPNIKPEAIPVRVRQHADVEAAHRRAAVAQALHAEAAALVAAYEQRMRALEALGG